MHKRLKSSDVSSEAMNIKSRFVDFVENDYQSGSDSRNKFAGESTPKNLFDVLVCSNQKH